jgi:ribosomal protein L37AE/L43A
VRTTETLTEKPLQQIVCPSCGDVCVSRIPAMNTMISCRSCHAMIDKNAQSVVFQNLKKKIPKSKIELGAKGKLKGTEYEVVGVLERKADITWEEYLLYNPQKGFVWLTEHESHWNFIRILKSVPETVSSEERIHLGGRYRLNRRYSARFISGVGEFNTPIKVEEFVYDNQILTCEKTKGEQIWSIGEYIFPELIRDAFHVPVTTPTYVASNEVIRGDRYLKPTWIIFGIFMVLWIAFMGYQKNLYPKTVLINDIITFQDMPVTAVIEPQKDNASPPVLAPSMIKTLSVEQKPYANTSSYIIDGMKVTYTFKTEQSIGHGLLTIKSPTLINNWAILQIQSIHQETGQSFAHSITLQDLREGTERYLENTHYRMKLPTMKKGTYQISFDIKTDATNKQKFDIQLSKNVFTITDFIGYLLFAAFPPLFLSGRYLIFCIRRKLDSSTSAISAYKQTDKWTVISWIGIIIFFLIGLTLDD